jgi:hypothetical protein
MVSQIAEQNKNLVHLEYSSRKLTSLRRFGYGKSKKSKPRVVMCNVLNVIMLKTGKKIFITVPLNVKAMYNMRLSVQEICKCSEYWYSETKIVPNFFFAGEFLFIHRRVI